MYTTPWCGYCSAAKTLLADKGIEFESIDVSTDPGLRKEMMDKSGRRTVPQIFIDDQAVGGYDDIAALNSRGELDAMLGLK